MKKVLLTAMAILTVASASAFGMYGWGASWIDFLTHGNQLRARMDQLGFVLGNGTIKGTLGFRANKGSMGSIISSGFSGDRLNSSHSLDATISAGLGYTSDMFGIGVGYNFTYINPNLYVHTPVLMINALNNNLRISAPIQVAVSDNVLSTPILKTKYTGIAFDNIQLRYYTGIDAFNAIRFYVNYRNVQTETSFNSSDAVEKESAESLGFQLRLYFLNTQVGNVGINPFIRLEYHTVLRGNQDALGVYTASSIDGALGDSISQSTIYDVNPFKVAIKPVLSLSASSDLVSLYLEPSLGYTVVSEKIKGLEQQTAHALTWGAYAELYVTPVKDLEWYFEMDVNGNVTGKDKKANADLPPVLFETTTGITWYLPSFGGAQE